MSGIVQQPEHRTDWVLVDRAVRGRAAAADLSPSELAEAVHVLRRRGWADNAIAAHLRTSPRRVRETPEGGALDHLF